MTAALPLALAALVPVMLGPLPSEPRLLTATLCNGSTITLPIGDSAPDRNGPCHPTGCHAGECRAKSAAKGSSQAI